INTCSPALDVTFPSNYARLVSFYEEAPAVMRNMVYPASIDDETTLAVMEKVWKKHHIFLDSHTAVAYAAAEQFAASRDYSGQVHTVVLATEHPAKEADIIVKTTGQAIPIPERFLALQKKADPVAVIEADIEAFEGAIASCF
ncbi:MAG: threonine synthase, partial [Treponema sp.]|nr:threonine synthase [Treponema sp.]